MCSAMLRAIISYDGSPYFGWQNNGHLPTIQGEIQKALSKLAKSPISVEAASRTDRGVHARGQVIQFSMPPPFEPIQLQKALNANLPQTIRVKGLSFQDFHPSIDATGKEYHYQICTELVQDPMLRHFSWHYYYPLSLQKILESAKDLIGTHDFSAFSNQIEENPICTLEKVEFDGRWFRIKGDRFLYKMVRNLIGTLVYIGSNRLEGRTIPAILASNQRKKAGMSAPAHGLFLHQVFYPVK